MVGYNLLTLYVSLLLTGLIIKSFLSKEGDERLYPIEQKKVFFNEEEKKSTHISTSFERISNLTRLSKCIPSQTYPSWPHRLHHQQSTYRAERGSSPLHAPEVRSVQPRRFRDFLAMSWARCSATHGRKRRIHAKGWGFGSLHSGSMSLPLQTVLQTKTAYRIKDFYCTISALKMSFYKGNFKNL